MVSPENLQLLFISENQKATFHKSYGPKTGPTYCFLYQKAKRQFSRKKKTTAPKQGLSFSGLTSAVMREQADRWTHLIFISLASARYFDLTRGIFSLASPPPHFLRCGGSIQSSLSPLLSWV